MNVSCGENAFEMLSFNKGALTLGVNMLDVEEIVKARFGAINKIPASPGQLIGLMNIRGRVVPVINASFILSQTKLEPDENEEVTLLVSKYDGELIALIVDHLGEVVSADTLYPIDAGELISRFARGVVMENGRSIYVLDIAKLLEESLEID